MKRRGFLGRIIALAAAVKVGEELIQAAPVKPIEEGIKQAMNVDVMDGFHMSHAPLLPNVTKAQRMMIQPVPGTMYYQSDTVGDSPRGLKMYTGSEWVHVDYSDLMQTEREPKTQRRYLPGFFDVS